MQLNLSRAMPWACAFLLAMSVAGVHAQSSSSAVPPALDLNLAQPAPPPAEPSGEIEPKQLNEIVVKSKHDALSDSDRRLRELVGKLPCTGCDTKGQKIEAKRSLTEKAVRLVANQCCIPSRPPETDEAGRLDHQLTQETLYPTNNHP